MALAPSEQLAEATRLLLQATQPEKIILFGSRARGDADADSDLDLLVILPRLQNRADDYVRLRMALAPLRAPIDLLVYSSDEIAQHGHIWGTALYEALREGVVLYAAS